LTLPFVEESPLAFGGYRPPRERSRYSVVGIPFDSTVTFRGGQRWAPRSIREASAFIEFRSLHAGIDVDYIPIYDEGDVAVVPGDALETLKRVSSVAEAVAGEGRILVGIGGEHTVTYGLFEGVSKALGSPPCLLIFDAHFDLREEYLGYRFSHACVMRRIAERLHPPFMVYVGVRGFADEELRFAESKEGISYVTSLDLFSMGEANIAARVSRKLSDCKALYLTIDIDFLDPSEAPGVGNPEPLGLSMREALNLLHSLVDDRLVAFDVVEVAPPYDVGGITSINAAKIIVEIIAAVEKAVRGLRRG